MDTNGIARGDGTDRATSPALGMVIAVLVTLLLAVAVGVLVGTISEDPGPDADFEWTESGEGDGLRVTLTHAGGESFNGSRASVEADGTGIDGSVTLAQLGTVREGNSLTVGLVRNARLEGDRVNGTEDGGRDVIAVAYGNDDLENGYVLVRDEEEDVSMRDLEVLRLTWTSFGFTSELDEHVIEG